MNRREANQLWRRLRRQGFVVERTGGDHMRITHPKVSGIQVFAASTPSDSHAKRNVLATIRRMLAFDKEPSP